MWRRRSGWQKLSDALEQVETETFYLPVNEEPYRPIRDLGPPLCFDAKKRDEATAAPEEKILTDEEIRHHAYLLWLQSKNNDPVANWHDAIAHLSTRKEKEN